ncbi:1,4-dihydroxy-6-naphthoate synthase [Desulfosporosinus meridiei]|uniref:1,4-dihydroxy-6-naphtoate synthase n=1 Tax=Desulfosporosinus meridiei (strain ATCC BAA-275 / DSM 13257 / KCTC 12902 / NCIMB 13706 / S10) TaxID=768704 RepID=J7IRP5_DESMD|nr:1,4-dihydroxy-6-naphthoate synthase [Desulfosporosinus meridiei]AFQ42854.1 putative periplasmic solute-binding protein [Desulfosporosinus meridiei DSM 13257]
MKIAFSPCPNDTFVFHAWVHGLIPGAPGIDVKYADIDITNNLAAASGDLDVVKISYAALPWVLSDYALLPCGGALGKGCGPLLLMRNPNKLYKLAGIHNCRVAVPSERSTAYLLFRLWAAQNVPGGVGEIIVLPFHEIMPAVRDGLVDIGLVIHEARFTYPSYGLALMVDLGGWWEQETNLPIPLGAIVARRSLDLSAIAAWIRESVRYAWAHPKESKEYILYHSRELSEEVTQAHIKLYVNEFTENIGEMGYKAVATLLGKAAQEGLVPKIDWEALKY